MDGGQSAIPDYFSRLHLDYSDKTPEVFENQFFALNTAQKSGFGFVLDENSSRIM